MRKVKYLLPGAYETVSLKGEIVSWIDGFGKRPTVYWRYQIKGVYAVWCFWKWRNLKKIYTRSRVSNPVHALENVCFSVKEGEYVAIMGESGSGKTTLLNILACLDQPTEGEILLEGKDTLTIPERDISAFRRKNLGFVFQDFNLLDTFSIRDNIFLPLVLSGESYKSMNQKLRPIAERLRILDILGKYPYEVSGGQKQRAAVARALITNPKLILADEPTGALDSKSSGELLSMFDEINQGGQTILMVTHSVQAASHAGESFL